MPCLTSVFHVELSSFYFIAVFPFAGWSKTRSKASGAGRGSGDPNEGTGEAAEGGMVKALGGVLITFPEYNLRLWNKELIYILLKH